MRIGIDARLWNETGVGRYIRSLVKYLQILDHENDYILFVRSDSLENVKCQMSNIPSSLKLRRTSKWRVVRAEVRWHTLAEQWLMSQILSKERLDLVHFPYFNVPIFYRQPFVVTIHDLIITHFPTGQATTLPSPLYQMKRLGYKIVLSQALKNARKIIAVSESTKKEIIDHFGVSPGKIVVIYESGELDIPKNHKSEIINHKLKKPYLLYVGNAHPHKNLERLLEVILSIKYEVLGIKLILVGRQDYFYKRLKEKVKEMGLEEQVVFFGEASDGELSWLYKNAQALILPSLMEGFGLPAVEAMAAGCLILASDTPALREVCGAAAIYFDPTSVEDIATVLRRYDTSSYHSKIKNGLARAKMFSWEKMARQTLAVYKEFK